VCLLAALANLAFLTKAVHIDEAFFLAPVPQILKDPWHPLNFTLNWTGVARTGWYTPSATSYFLAAAAWLARGSEPLMRLFWLPVDVLAACALYDLASRFLARPLWPTLLILVTPAWFISMPLLMSEKWLMCSILISVCALLRGLERDAPAWFWASAAFASLAILIKLTAALVLLPLLAMQWRGGLRPARIAGYLAVCAIPVMVDNLWLEPGRMAVIRAVSQARPSDLWSLAHRLRAFLAFPAGCSVAAAVWPYARYRASRGRLLAVLAGSGAAAVLLFSPFLDFPGPGVRAIDRLLGVVFAAGTLATLLRLLEPRSRRLPGWWLWASWAGAGMLVGWVNWYLSARSVLLWLPALMLACAERLESETSAARLEILCRFCFPAVLALSLALAVVDAHYAQAQRALANYVKTSYVDRGRKAWFTGHWGLQYYLEKAGAAPLDESRGGWSETGPGDVVILPMVNASQLYPPSGLTLESSEFAVAEPIPLRLMGGPGLSEAGFYSSLWGFLPYSISDKPLDAFRIFEKP